MEESHYSWDCEKAPCGIPAVGFFYAFHMLGLTFFLSIEINFLATSRYYVQFIFLNLLSESKVKVFVGRSKIENRFDTITFF